MSDLLDGRLILTDGPMTIHGYHPAQAHCAACAWAGPERRGLVRVERPAAVLDVNRHQYTPRHLAAVRTTTRRTP